MPKNAQTIAQLHSSHMLVKECSKFFKPGFRSMWTENFQIFKLDLEKAEEQEIKLPTSVGSQKKQESSRKTSISALLTMPKSLTVLITANCGKFLKEMEILDHLTWLLRNVYGGQEATFRPDTEQWADSKLGKEYVKAVYCHPAYLTYMQSISWEMPDWMKHKLESRLLGEISIASDKQMTPPLWQKANRNWRASWWKWKRKVKKLA